MATVRAVADEYLFVFSTACTRSNFVTTAFLIERGFHLDGGAVVQQIQVGGECTGVGLSGKALPGPLLHVHSPGVYGAPSPQQGAIAKDALNSLGKQRLQRRKEVSGGRKELPHAGSLLSGL